jgi:hypothetical protein
MRIGPAKQTVNSIGRGQDWHSIGCGTVSQAQSAMQSAMRNLFCFLGLGLRACSPYRHRRDCGAPQPGKQKQKRYDYGCAVVIVHRFPFSFLCTHK